MSAISESNTVIDFARLDAAIERLKSKPGIGVDKLLVEHLQTAYAYLHGAMPTECIVNLELAQQIVGQLPDKSLQQEISAMIADLVGHLHSIRPHPAAAVPQRRPGFRLRRSLDANEVADYFHGDATTFGIFYPTNHVVAVQPSFESASACMEILLHAGVSSRHTAAVNGPEFGLFLEQLRTERSLGEMVMTSVSRFLDTAAPLADRYVNWAKEGRGFVFVRTQAEEAAVRISALLSEFKPLSIHWFTTGYIRHMIIGEHQA